MNASIAHNPTVAQNQLFGIYKGLPWFRGIYSSPYNGRMALHITVTDCQIARDHGVPADWGGFRVYLWRV